MSDPGAMSDSGPGFANVYADETRASAYAELEYPGTYYLAFRDLPALLRRHVSGNRALDFGCGAGRSSRFLRSHGFEVTGIDISAAMLAHARAADPDGDYRLIGDGELDGLERGGYDLVFSAFAFDNIPASERKIEFFTAMRRLLAENGRIVNLVSAPELYLHEWASFSTEAFPENRDAVTDDIVRLVMLDVPDARPVEDILCREDDYVGIFRAAGLEPLEILRPLGAEDDPCEWVTETSVPPWAIYVVGAR